MKKILSLTIFLITTFCFSSNAQLSRLNAGFDAFTQTVKLDWNMISNPAKTTYVLLRSADGKFWTEVVTDRVLQLYTGEDIFDYDDKTFVRESNNYYRLKIIDVNKSVIAYSNMVVVNTETGKGLWVIYPNPVNDVLTLSFKGNGTIKGVINIVVYDVSGKAVIKFRSASIYRTIQIPVTKLQNGYYVVQINVMNELLMKQRFIKQ